LTPTPSPPAKKLTGARAAALAGLAAALLGAGLWLARRPSAPLPAPPRGGTLTATIRSEPRSFNRLVARDRTSNLVSLLVHDRLVRINLATQQVEPALAERWSLSADGRRWTLHLRRGVRFSDGQPFTAADVLFSLRAVYDSATGSPLADSLLVGGRPLEASALDASTVVITAPAPFGPGVRILDNLPVLPRHRLEPFLAEGRLREAWGLTTPLDEMAGLGPFVLREYVPGERLIFARNPHYWERDEDGAPLPRLDRLVLLVVPDQNAEMLRLEAGEVDLVTGEVRPDDLAAVRRLAAAGRLRLFDLGVGLDPEFFWFNLTPGGVPANRRWLQGRELRQAISLGVDRQAMADTVYQGAAVPVAGPVTPGNRDWHDPGLAVPPYDPARARALLAAAGLRDTDGDGVLETPGGEPARFTLLTQKGNTLRERGAAFLQQDLARLGLRADIVTLEQPALVERLTSGYYEAIYFGTQASDTDPASNLDFWLSGGAFHFWHPEQPAPATPWEARIDALMHQQVAATDPAERRRLFAEVQRIFAEELPAICFVAPRVYVATSARVTNVRPGLLQPYILWDAARLGVRD
jgi:peptide/nickel transport system substrate-binding protein